MNKQEMINQGYRYIATQNSGANTEIWARFTGYEDTITYVCYNLDKDVVIEQTRQTISYTFLDIMAQMRDKMREDFLKDDVKYDGSCIWTSKQ